MTWDDYADGWDEDEGARAYSRAAFECLARLTESRGASLGGARVLDFGCGTGLLTEKLAPVCEAIVAVDTSVRMIERLRHKIDRLGLANVQTTTAAVEEIVRHTPMLVAGGFDFVVCSSVCAFLDDYSGTVSNLVRLLKLRGIFVQWDWELDPQAKDPHGLTRDQIAETLASSGLEVVQVETAFEIPMGDKMMRPLMGIGEKSA